MADRSASRAAAAPVGHAPFGLVLGGGGARGLAHAGVLRTLEHLGYRPSLIVGVSMGAVVGATYALNANWYAALKDMDVSGFPRTPDFRRAGILNRLRNLQWAQRMISGMLLGWGVGAPAVAWGRDLLEALTCGGRLEDGRVPVIASATDLENGARVLMRSGPAAEALYASAAIAGILPPAQRDGRLLIDGGYSDIAPVDVVRAAGVARVIAVDASISAYGSPPHNGVAAMLRAVEICQTEHNRMRFALADLVLRPVLDPPVEVMDFGQLRRCTAAGICATRAARAAIAELLEVPQTGEAAGA